jgi:O-antigen/teichoic acid export membrane protein
VVLIKFCAGAVLIVLAIIPAFLIKNTGIVLIAYIAGLTLVTAFKTTQDYFRANHKPGIYVLSAIVFSLIMVGSTIVYVVVLKMGSDGVVMGSVTVNVLLGMVCVVFLARNSRINLDFKLARSMISYGAPLAFGNLAAFFLGFTDKIMIKAMAGDSALGLYAFSFKFGQLFLGLLIMPFFLSWNPVRWEILKRPDAKRIFSRLANAINILIPSFTLISSGVFIIGASILSQSSEYLEGLKIVPLITLGFAYYGLYYFDSMGILFSGKTKRITLILFSTAFLNLILNFVLIHAMGYFGAALATAGSYFFMRWITLVISQRIFPVERNHLLQYLPIMIASAACVVAAVKYEVDLLQEISVMLIACGILLALALIFINPSVFKGLHSFLRNMRRERNTGNDKEHLSVNE